MILFKRTLFYFLSVFLLLPACVVSVSADILVDHTSTNLISIPDSAIIQAKNNLHIVYGHTSHGSQLISGMGGSNGDGLVNFLSGSSKYQNSTTPELFRWNNGGSGGALDLHDRGMGGDVGYYPQWVDNTRSYLNVPSNSDVNVVIWSWCGQASSRTEQEMTDTYLTPMAQLESDYPEVTFVYMTGHLDGSGADGNLNLRNEQIRKFCRDNNKVLYDFADIESYAPGSSDNLMERNATDGCDYIDSNGDRQNWATDWQGQDSHVEGDDWWASGAAHSQHLNGNLKGYAAWWLWARIAGWNPGDETNNSPILDSIGSQTVYEGELLEFTVNGSDPDGDELVFDASTLPQGAEFNAVSRVFSWTPALGTSGTYSTLFSVTDNGTPALNDTETVSITVSVPNRPPVLDSIGSKGVQEGERLEFTISGRDPDGDDLSFEAFTLPEGAEFNVSTHIFSWTPAAGSAGTYTVQFSVMDTAIPPLVATETVSITVTNTNHPPVLEQIGSKNVLEGESLEFTISGSDPDDDDLIFDASTLPPGAEFSVSTRTFSWTPALGSADIYSVLFSLTDNGTPQLNDTEVVTITVTSVNHPPVLDSIGSKGIQEGELLEFTVSGSDPDGNDLVFDASDLPQDAEFDASTGEFSWTPSLSSAGTYSVIFSVTDNGNPQLSTTENVSIVVTNANEPPVLDPIGNKSVPEGELLEFTISGSDPDGDEFTFDSSTLPEGAEFNAVTGEFNWTPAVNHTGTYTILFSVTDNGTPPLNDTESVIITVTGVNQPPEKPIIDIADNQAEPTLTPEFILSPFIDMDSEDTHAETLWQISAASDFSDCVIDEASTTSLTDFTVPGSVLNPDTQYYVRAKVSDNNGGESEWSDAFSYQTPEDSDDNPDDEVPPCFIMTILF